MAKEVSIETFDDIFGIESNEKYWLGIEDFDTVEEYNAYLEEFYVPWAKEKGVLE